MFFPLETCAVYGKTGNNIVAHYMKCTMYLNFAAQQETVFHPGKILHCKMHSATTLVPLPC